MDEIEFLKGLFDHKIVEILKYFIASSGKQFYLKEISDAVGVPMATTHRILQKLHSLEIIIETNISKFKIYQLADNEQTKFLSRFIRYSVKAVEIFADQVSKVPNIQRIILHGKEADNRASLLLIGEGIDVSYVKSVVTSIKEQYNYNITHMTLSEEQYQQMSDMGLYSGSKKILFERSTEEN